MKFEKIRTLKNIEFFEFLDVYDLIKNTYAYQQKKCHICSWKRVKCNLLTVDFLNNQDTDIITLWRTAKMSWCGYASSSTKRTKSLTDDEEVLLLLLLRLS